MSVKNHPAMVEWYSRSGLISPPSIDVGRLIGAESDQFKKLMTSQFLQPSQRDLLIDLWNRR